MTLEELERQTKQASGLVIRRKSLLTFIKNATGAPKFEVAVEWTVPKEEREWIALCLPSVWMSGADILERAIADARGQIADIDRQLERFGVVEADAHD